MCKVSWCEQPSNHGRKNGYCNAHASAKSRGHDPERYVPKSWHREGRIEDVLELRSRELTLREVAERLGVCSRTVERDLKAHREETAA